MMRATPDISLKKQPFYTDRNQLSIDEIDQRGYGASGYFLITLSVIFSLLTLPCNAFNTIIIKEYERAVVFRLGKIRDGRAKGPGILYMLPCIDQVVMADMRTQTFEVQPQEILTKDSVTISVDAVVYIKIFDPTLSIIHVENAQYSTRELSATCLRKVLGTKTLQEALQDRENVAKCLQEVLDEVTHEWGVEVERVEIKDISLPTQMQRVMAIEAEASREYKATIIYADGELKSSAALKSAADVIKDSPIALQLRYMQTLSHITVNNESTIFFPFPLDMTSGFREDKKADSKFPTKDEIEEILDIPEPPVHKTPVYKTSVNRTREFFTKSPLKNEKYPNSILNRAEK